MSNVSNVSSPVRLPRIAAIAPAMLICFLGAAAAVAAQPRVVVSGSLAPAPCSAPPCSPRVVSGPLDDVLPAVSAPVLGSTFSNTRAFPSDEAASQVAVADLVAAAVARLDPAAPEAQGIPRRWSAPRLLVGAALAGAGVWYALSERRCRLNGALAGFAPSPGRPGAEPSSARLARQPNAELQIAYGGARNAATAWTGSGCSLDWEYTSEEFWSARVGDRLLGPVSYADVDPKAVQSWSTTESSPRGDVRPALQESLDAMRGTIATEDYLPPSRLYSGLGMAAAGGILAIFFSRVNVPDAVTLDVAPDRASLSLNLGF